MSMISSLIERLRETANDIFMNIGADFPVCKADGELMSEAADTLEMLSEKARPKGKCIWCSSPYRIEYYWIDRDGNTASYQDEGRHIVATGIAKYCPNCGAKMEVETDDRS